MNAQELIKASIGKKCVVTGYGDLAMDRRLRKIIFDKDVTIVGLTKGGMACVSDKDGTLYSVPPRNIEIIEK